MSRDDDHPRVVQTMVASDDTVFSLVQLDSTIAVGGNFRFTHPGEGREASARDWKSDRFDRVGDLSWIKVQPMQYPSGWARKMTSHATVRLRYMAWWYQNYHLVVIYYIGTPSDAMEMG